VLALVVSGGHTHLYLAEDRERGWTYHNVGQTRDDAAGEAFDKVAKLLGLGYPGGPVIDKLAAHGNPLAIAFATPQIKKPARYAEPGGHLAEFSYSGIKTAVLRYVETHNLREAIESRRAALTAIPKPGTEDYLRFCDRETLNLVASFQHAMVDDLVGKTLAAARDRDVATLFVTGGVAANHLLRQRFEERAAQEGLPVFFPSRPLSTDNAAMIAAAAYPKFLAREMADPEFSAEAALRLG